MVGQPIRVITFACVLAAMQGRAGAGPLAGRLELPPAPERPKVNPRGFVDRADNARKKIQPLNVAAHLLVVLESDAKREGGGQVALDLVGESFARPVLGVPAGTEVTIKNQSKTARTLVALEDAKLIAPGPINPTGPKSFKTSAPAIYTITDPDAPHLRAKVVVVASSLIATVDPTGKFELPDVPEGSYRLRVFFRDGWIDRPDESVTVGAKRTEVTVKLPAGYPLKK